MSIFDIFKKSDINDGIKEFKTKENAVLLDVRTFDEYRSGHIENSINIPLQSLNAVLNTVTEKNTPIYIYCHSGLRSSQAAEALNGMGYSNVKDIGGIMGYKGAIKGGV